MGFKASYANDENLVIIQNSPALVQAYAIHVLDVYEHYRFAAVQQELHEQGKTGFDGFLSTDDKWLRDDLANSAKVTFLITYVLKLLSNRALLA
jgi:hypothetical protein